MKNILISCLISYLLTGLSYWKIKDNNTDNFGIALPYFIFITTSIILTAFYIILAIWNHRYV